MSEDGDPILETVLKQVNAQDVFDRLDVQPQNLRGAGAIKLASKLLEYAAYEVARAQPAGAAAHLILLSAELDHRSRDVLKS
jgi:hypothetical protein